MQHFHIRGLDPQTFQPLFGRDDAALRAAGAQRCVADQANAFPDRITLRDAAPGEALLLVHYEHQPAPTPFRASHAIYVREGSAEPFDAVDTIPPVLRPRTLSLRAFGADHHMLDADLVDGEQVEQLIEKLFSDPAVHYLHAHFARRGCFACRIDRA